MQLVAHYIRNIAGTASVEAAMIIPLVTSAGLGIMDASSLILQTNKMDTQLAIAAKYLAQSADPEAAEVDAKRLALTGQLTEDGDPVLPGWTIDDIQVSYRDITNDPTETGFSFRGSGTIRIVEISSTLNFVSNGVLTAIKRDAITLQAKHEERIVGGYAQ